MKSPQDDGNKTVSVAILLAVGLVAQLFSFGPLWQHRSDVGEVFGRYSYSYAIVLALYGVLLLVWLGLFLLRNHIHELLKWLPASWRFVFIGLSGLTVFVFWLTSVGGVVKQYLALNWLLASLVLIRSLPDRAINFRWKWGVALAVVLFIVPILITALTARPFSPDEAHWADFASSLFVAGGLYARTWLQDPITITPGHAWSTAAYGWFLENVVFDIKLGRIFNFVGYLLAFLGIGAVAWRLYGLRAAAVTMAFAALSRTFIPILDYRPDHQLPLAVMLIAFAALQARHSNRHRWRSGWHFACGLLATLSLQIHAAGIVFVFGFSLFYLMEFALQSYRQRRMASLAPLIWFGVGALLGTTSYYFLNIHPVGGLGPYLDHLIDERWRFNLSRRTWFLRWPSFLEGIVILAAIAFMLWRRTRADRMVLGILACVLIGIVLLDSQGYRTTFNALYMLPIGTLLVDGFQTRSITQENNRHSVLGVLCVLSVLIGQMAGTFIDWKTVGNWFTTGQLPPYLYTELRPMLTPFITDDDVVVSTHQLIWTFPDHLHLVTVAAETYAMRHWGLDKRVEVWERVQPTVIVYVENHMHFDPGLQAYIDERRFRVCQEFEVLEHLIQLYRQSCPLLGEGVTSISSPVIR